MALEGLTDCFSSTFLLTLLVIILVLYILNRRPSGLPPFPITPLPVVGNLFSLEKDPTKQFSIWRKTHGDIFSLYMGSRLVVVLNGFDCIREALVKNADMFSNRPDIIMNTHVFRGRGIGVTSGPVWKTQRKFSLIALRDFGFGRNSMEEKILEEAEHVINFFADKKGKKDEFQKIFNVSTSNILCSLVYGHRFEFDDKVFLECCNALDSLLKNISNVSATNFLPFMQYLPGQQRQMQLALESAQYFEDKLTKPEIQRHYEEFDGTAVDFISAYIKEIQDKESSGQDASILKDNFLQTINDLFIGGTETTATTLKWLILFLIRFPEVQKKCFQEIQDTIGCERLPTLKDKPQLSYVQATFAETQRLADIAPLGILHSVADNTVFRGFTVPKGAIVMVNMDSVLLDPKIWPNPKEFRPDRFLDESGQFFKPDAFIPFSTGRRVCLGESLAKMEIFLIGAALIQRFQFQQPDDEPIPSLEPVRGLASMPEPYKYKAVPRV